MYFDIVLKHFFFFYSQADSQTKHLTRITEKKDHQDCPISLFFWEMKVKQLSAALCWSKDPGCCDCRSNAMSHSTPNDENTLTLVLTKKSQCNNSPEVLMKQYI